MAKHPEIKELEAKLAELREQNEGAEVSMKVALFIEINNTEQLLNLAIDRHKEIRPARSSTKATRIICGQVLVHHKRLGAQAD